MTFVPLNRHVEIRPIKTEGFMVSTDTVFEEKGEVLSVADGVTSIAVGETVYFDSWLCAKYEDSNKEIRYLIKEDAIRAKEHE